jgi:hypothetical protein
MTSFAHLALIPPKKGKFYIKKSGYQKYPERILI